MRRTHTSTWILSLLLVVVSCASLYALGRCGTCNVAPNVLNATSPIESAQKNEHKENVEADLSTGSRLVGLPTRHSVPINIRTSGSYNAEYTQVGFLTGTNKENIIPLYGRMIMANRNKWQYYTMSDKYHSIRLPISVGGKNASSEYGCDEVGNGDTVYVEGYNAPFRVTLYEKQHFNYIPYL
jgi:hypothetical protein